MLVPHFILQTTDPFHPHFVVLRRTLEQNFPYSTFYIIGLGKLEACALSRDIATIADAMPSQESVLLYVDAFDVHYFPCGVNPADVLVRHFVGSDETKGFVSSMEANCYPKTFQAVEAMCNKLKRDTSPGKPYLNAGGWIGFARYVKTIFQAQAKMCTEQHQRFGYVPRPHEQGFYWNAVFGYWMEQLVAFDRDEEMFLSLSGDDEAPIALVNGSRIEVQPPRTAPVCFLHGNGQMGKERLEEYARERFEAQGVRYKALEHTFPLFNELR
jgi:hypothetical protein